MLHDYYGWIRIYYFKASGILLFQRVLLGEA
jgi:hypothetical protein